jgi:hypothetical protein
MPALLSSFSASVSLSISLQPIHIVMADATRTLDARLTMTRLRSVVLMLEGDSSAIRSGQMTARLSYHRAIPSPKKKGG